MKLIITLFLLALSLNLSIVHTSVTRSTAHAIGQSDFTESRKSLDNERYVKRLQIRNQTGLDGKVRRIHLDAEEDKPGIRAYGLPKNRLQDNGIIERVHVGKNRIDGTSRNSRLIEVYGMSKDDVETNGVIERLSPVTTDRQLAKLELPNEEIRARRSVRAGSGNHVKQKTASEAEDMEAQNSKVFRPLFVYRQQVAARQNRKHARNLAHRHHRHANHHYCDHHRRSADVIY